MSLSHPQSEGVVPLVGASSLSILNDFDPTTFHAREAGVSGLGIDSQLGSENSLSLK